ncbi:GNAT family N-acetyltransferase [Pseudalkalibacillus berkeleyi]|uniref:GNAT family N-acetyltransferase n=1 Tax=Pseudalkalibacillus berkeleyi TaxID=1069813 RepID=A0ABS9GZ92_9BACL|nr:GNAT family N-acetyltransferase [Pseudalkalibacillus berkeleyi]MCF6136908.1 GNAT family N-acetyltransferase [Pseudalkalibacillus berkeleyi]
MEVVVASSDSQKQDALKVRSKVFIDEQNVPEEEEIDQYENDCTHFVVYDGEKTIGAGRLRFVEDYAKVERVCILKEYRGSGVGKLLMQKMETVSSESSVNQLVLHAQTQAEQFYSKLGYETYSDVFMDAGIPHVAMKKSV